MLLSQLLLGAILGFLLFGCCTAAPLEDKYNEEVEDQEDTSFDIGYGVQKRYKRQEDTGCPPKQKLRDTDIANVPVCPAGEYSVCTKCPRGYYKHKPDKKRKKKYCAKCGCGKGTPREGALFCTQNCPRGQELVKEKEGKTNRVCSKCEFGFYQPEENLDKNSCIACPGNMTTKKKGSTSVSNCTCGFGFYQPEENLHKNSCIACPGNMTTKKKGSTSVSNCTYLCQPGQKVTENGTCAKCAIGYYQPNDNNDASCIACPHSKITGRGGCTSIDDCFLNCPAGQHPNSDNTTCTPCPLGWYKGNVGPKSCDECENNFTTAEEGTTARKKCKAPCEPGREYNATSGKCGTKCPTGTFKPEFSLRTKCRACPEHFTPNARKAATGCVPHCGPGYKLNDNKDNCTACGFGYYKTDTGNTPCQVCSGDQLTVSSAAKTMGECQDFNACAKPLVEKLENLLTGLDNMTAESQSFIDLMVNTCRLGPSATLVGLLEDVINSLQTCGIVGQIDLRDLVVGENIYKKEYYLEVLKEAYIHGGMCDFVQCVPDTVPEMKMSKSWIRNDTCQPTDGKCFCSETYRALATSFHTNLKNCPAMQFHSEFLEVNIGGTEMINSLLSSSNISKFCALSNSCAGVGCGYGTCSSLSSGDYQCRCWFGYTGESCKTAQNTEQETEPDTTMTPTTIASTSKPPCDCTTNTRSTPSTTTRLCPTCKTCPQVTCPTQKPCENHTTAAPTTCPPCTTPEPLMCPTPTEPSTCPQCTTTEAPTCPPCTTTEAPTCPPCTTTEFPTCPPCTTTDSHTCPPPEPCTTTKAPTCPPPEPCTTTKAPTCPPCTTTEAPTCPPCTTTESPTCPPCTTTEAPTCPPCTTTEAPTCPPPEPCTTVPPEPCTCPTPDKTTCRPCDPCPTTLPPTEPTPCPPCTTATSSPHNITCNCSTHTETSPGSTPSITTSPKANTTVTVSAGTSAGSVTSPPIDVAIQCGKCESQMLKAYFTFGNSVCGPDFLDSINCFFTHGCTGDFLYDKYSLYNLMMPQLFPWDSSYDLLERQTALCSADGPDTSSQVPTTKVTTPRMTTEVASCYLGLISLNIANGAGRIRDNTGDGSAIGTIIDFECDDGFQIDGDHILVCTNNGQWSAPNPSCRRKTCLLPSIANGIVTPSTLLIDFNSVASVTCTTGYTFEDPTITSMRCMADRNVNQIPKCVDEDECSRQFPPCEHQCRNLAGSYFCSCNPGYQPLQGDPDRCTVQTSTQSLSTSKPPTTLTSSPTTQNQSSNSTSFSHRTTKHPDSGSTPGSTPGQAIPGSVCNSDDACKGFHSGSMCLYNEQYGNYCQCPSYAPYYQLEQAKCVYGSTSTNASTTSSVFTTRPSTPSPTTTSQISSHGTTSGTGSEPVCDIHKETCANHGQCVLDAYTLEAHCRCVGYGRNKTDGNCRTTGADNNENCDPDALYPCRLSGSSCNRTETDSEVPICKCNEGYVFSSYYGYCEKANGSLYYPCDGGKCHFNWSECTNSSGGYCNCKANYTSYDGSTCTPKVRGKLYEECDNMDNGGNGKCYAQGSECVSGYCYCEDKLTMVDGSKCVNATGTVLGGLCYQGDGCFVNNSKCDWSGGNSTCKCLTGYRDSGTNRGCERIPGMVKECRNDQSNCLTEGNTECHWKSVAFYNKTEYINVCLCKAGFKMRNNDTCDADTSTTSSVFTTLSTRSSSTTTSTTTRTSPTSSHITDTVTTTTAPSEACKACESGLLMAYLVSFDVCSDSVRTQLSCLERECYAVYFFTTMLPVYIDMLPADARQWESFKDINYSLAIMCHTGTPSTETSTTTTVLTTRTTTPSPTTTLSVSNYSTTYSTSVPDPVCDIHEEICANNGQCVLDAYTNEARCRCVDYGRNRTDMNCRTVGAKVNHECDPDARYPCLHYGSSCNRTTAAVTVCKCNEGYSLSSNGTCEKPTLYETCNHTLQYPCSDDYSTECVWNNTRNNFTCQCKQHFLKNENGNYCTKVAGYLYQSCVYGTNGTNGICFTHGSKCTSGSCYCEEDYTSFDGSTCVKKSRGKLYEECDKNKTCYTKWSKCNGGICQCEENYASVNGSSCSYATGKVLGGLCNAGKQCFVNNTKCVWNNGKGTCKCLKGYHDIGTERGCERVSGMIKECRNDQSNCLTESYAECLWKSVAFNNKTEYVNVCVCKAGYVMRENDICDTDTQSTKTTRSSVFTTQSTTSPPTTTTSTSSHSTTYSTDTDPECDIYKDFYQACGNHAYCVLDAYTQKAHCRCVDYGKHKTNGTCKTNSAKIGEECDQAARYPCYDTYSMECTSTVASSLPVCKCKQGYSEIHDPYQTYCEKQVANLYETCNSTVTCSDEQAMICKIASGGNHMTCQCKQGYQKNDDDSYDSYCVRSHGFLGQQCNGTEKKCYQDGTTCDNNYLCTCETNYTSFDGSCVLATGKTLGGHCASSYSSGSGCYIVNSKCDWSDSQGSTCKCLTGYHNSENNMACVRNEGTVKECLHDLSNCENDNAECMWRSLSHDGKIEEMNLCLCKPGYKRSDNDKCETDACLLSGITCGNNAECTDPYSVALPCQCKDGYTGNGYTCSDIDECTDMAYPGASVCGVNAYCINTEGSYTCECLTGFHKDGTVCKSDGTAQGQEVPDALPCYSDADCFAFNAECILYASNTQGSCRCSPRQMLDGTMCKNGSCPSEGSRACDGMSCFNNEGCSNEKICCQDNCGEHCVLPRFHLDSCQHCLDDYYELDLSTELCQKGGYNVNKCFSEAGCNEQTQIRVILSDTRLDPYKVLLNLTNLDSLWASYKQHCDGIVAGSYCYTDGTCSQAAWLDCLYPDDNHLPENSKCQCQPHYEEDEFGRCFPIAEDACSLSGMTCDNNAECIDSVSGTLYCQCRDGYTGDGFMCTDIDECMDMYAYTGSSVCGSNAYCMNTEGSYTCECNTGFHKDGTDCTPDETTQGQEIPGVTPCDSDATCSPFNAKCIKSGFSTQGSCRCSLRQMLDGSMCKEGSCPMDHFEACGDYCFNNDDCSDEKICCPDETCGEHCVLPRFQLDSCQHCLNEYYNPLDLSTELCQKGGYTVNECFSEAGCNEQTQIRDLLYDSRLTMYGELNFTNLDSLWASYREQCDGKVNGSYCKTDGTCNEDGLECHNPDGYLSENSRCQCQTNYEEDEFGRCVYQDHDCSSSTVCEGRKATCSVKDSRCHCEVDHVYVGHMCVNEKCKSCADQLTSALTVATDECSFQVANTVECFLKNCTEEEFIVYANDPLNDLLGDGGHASSRTGLELSFYTHKCAGHLLGHACSMDSKCYLSDSSCMTDTQGNLVCQCTDPFVEGSDGNCIMGTDICMEATHLCDQNAYCISTTGSFTCECNPGFSGDGYTCTRTLSCEESSAELMGVMGLSSCSVDVSRAVQAVLTSCSEEEFVTQSASFAPLFYALGIDDSLSSRADLELAYFSQICGTDICMEATHLCDQNAYCISTTGSFTCECNPGFSGDGYTCTRTLSCEESSAELMGVMGLSSCSVDVNRAVHAVLTSCSEEEFVAQSASFAPLFYALGIDDSLSSRADLELAYISQICEEETGDDPLEGYSRTIIMMKYPLSLPGDQFFIRGGLDHELYTECKEDGAKSLCTIPIKYNPRNETSINYQAFNAWKQGDTVLDWDGPENGQGNYYDSNTDMYHAPQGTPTVRTSMDPSKEDYVYLNTFGDNYWMVDFYVKCDFTRDDGWFDVKGYPVIDGIGKWENPFDYDLHNECYDGPLSPLSHNHKAKCGMLNVFHFSEHNSEDSYCSVTSIPEDANIMA